MEERQIQLNIMKNLNLMRMRGSLRPQLFAKTLTGNRWKYDTQFSDKIVRPEQLNKASLQEGQGYCRLTMNCHLMLEIENVK
jgi:hypothetical protein